MKLTSKPANFLIRKKNTKFGRSATSMFEVFVWKLNGGNLNGYHLSPKLDAWASCAAIWFVETAVEWRGSGLFGSCTNLCKTGYTRLVISERVYTINGATNRAEPSYLPVYVSTVLRTGDVLRPPYGHDFADPGANFWGGSKTARKADIFFGPLPFRKPSLLIGFLGMSQFRRVSSSQKLLPFLELVAVVKKYSTVWTIWYCPNWTTSFMLLYVWRNFRKKTGRNVCESISYLCPMMERFRVSQRHQKCLPIATAKRTLARQKLRMSLVPLEVPKALLMHSTAEQWFRPLSSWHLRYLKKATNKKKSTFLSYR